MDETQNDDSGWIFRRCAGFESEIAGWAVGVISRMSQLVDISNARSQTIYNIHEETNVMWQKLIKMAVTVKFYLIVWVSDSIWINCTEK